MDKRGPERRLIAIHANQTEIIIKISHNQLKIVNDKERLACFFFNTLLHLCLSI